MFRSLRRTPETRNASDVAELLERFVDGTVKDDREWDDFLCTDFADPQIEAIRKRSSGLPEEFPPDSPDHYCSEAGIEVLREFARKLRGRSKAADDQ